MTYVFAGLSQIQRLEHFKVILETEDKIINVTASAITIANAAPYQFWLKVQLTSFVMMDLLDITIIGPSLCLQMDLC